MYSDPFCIYIPSFIWLWKILIFSVLRSGLCEESRLCFVLFFSSSPRQRKSNWLIQVRTIVPQIWEKLVLVLFSGPGDRRGGLKDKDGFSLAKWSPREIPPWWVSSLRWATPTQLKNMKTKQNRTSVACTFHRFRWKVREWHGLSPLGSLTGGSGIRLVYFMNAVEHLAGPISWVCGRSLKVMVSEFGDNMKTSAASRGMGWGMFYFVIQSVFFPIPMCLEDKLNASGS